jgi:hypothetical protein
MRNHSRLHKISLPKLNGEGRGWRGEVTYIFAPQNRIKERLTMKYVRIVKNTFIKGMPAAKGQEYEVDDRTAVLLSTKAIQIDKPGGKEKESEDTGPMERFTVVRQQETVVRPVGKNKLPANDNTQPAAVAAPAPAEKEEEEKPVEKMEPEKVKRGAGGKFKSMKRRKK